MQSIIYCTPGEPCDVRTSMCWVCVCVKKGVLCQQSHACVRSVWDSVWTCVPCVFFLLLCSCVLCLYVVIWIHAFLRRSSCQLCFFCLMWKRELQEGICVLACLLLGLCVCQDKWAFYIHKCGKIAQLRVYMFICYMLIYICMCVCFFICGMCTQR